MVPLLKGMDVYERAKIADCIKETTFQQGDIVIKEGEEGNVFYIVIEGSAVAQKKKEARVEGQKHHRQTSSVTLKVYNSPGEYFGELSLLKDQTRAATVVATSTLKLAMIDRAFFKRILGPL